MQEHDVETVREAVKLAFPAVDQDLGRDLWPVMSRRTKAAARVVPWYDWALAGALAGVFVFFPKLMLLLAYHL